MTYIILTGPSSVGKTTYAKQYYKNYTIIDSDDIWFQLAEEYKNNKTRINKDIFRRMYKLAIKLKNVVLIHTDPKPLLEFFNREDAEIILLATNFKKLARNLTVRKNRPTSNVLGNNHTGYLYYFTPTNTKTNSLYLKKIDLDKVPVKNKDDKKAVDNIISVFFKKNRKTTHIIPKLNMIYDKFIII